MKYILKNADILTGMSFKKGTVAIEGGKISHIWYDDEEVPQDDCAETIDLEGKILMAGAIDAHVHFRDPGLTWKGDIETESKAALLGGVTSYIDMPNTIPTTTSVTDLDNKIKSAEGRSWADYGFHLGASATNIDDLRNADRKTFGAIKVFAGSSTGNMKVDNPDILREIFKIKDKVVMVHCEDQDIIDASLSAAKDKYKGEIPFKAHPDIRSRSACISSTAKILSLAMELGTRVHICHISTAEEITMIRTARMRSKGITAETSANYLWFCDEDYDRLEGKIKCNPAIKKATDRQVLVAALNEGHIDTIGSDHAPHLIEEKMKPYIECPSGMPSIQNEISVLFTIAAQTGMSPCKIARAVSERPAEIFGIEGKGFIKEGYDADLVVVDTSDVFSPEKPAYKCGWSPYEGEKLTGAIQTVFLRGQKVVDNGVVITDKPEGKPLSFL